MNILKKGIISVVDFVSFFVVEFDFIYIES